MEFKAQKALHKFQEADKKNPKFLGEEYMIFEKYDGWYGYYQDGVIYSRVGRVIPSVQWLAKKIEDASPGLYGVLIFEILVEGYPTFSDLNGILNRKREPAVGAYLKVHDRVDSDIVCQRFSNRYAAAYLSVNSIDLPEVTLAEVLDVSNDPEVWQKYAEQSWAQGGEGVILKQAAAPFAPGKRNATLMKIKEELTLDLCVTGMFEGEGKYAGTLGGLIVAGKDAIQHRVSGMTDAQRTEWWESPGLILGEIVEVKAMKKLKDGSLREPRFKAIRHDKLVCDMD